MSSNKYLTEKVAEAARAREAGDLAKSRKIFEDILSQISILRNSTLEKDKNLYVDLMGQWIIQLRNEARTKLSDALKLAQGVYRFSEKENLNNGSAVRGVSNTLMNLEGYELAEKYLLQRLNYEKKSLDKVKIADSYMHLAKCSFRLGKVQKAKNYLTKALGHLYSVRGSRSLSFASTASGAYFLKALFYFDQGNFKGAKQTVEAALSIARKYNLELRINQIQGLLDLINEKAK